MLVVGRLDLKLSEKHSEQTAHSSFIVKVNCCEQFMYKEKLQTFHGSQFSLQRFST